MVPLRTTFANYACMDLSVIAAGMLKKYILFLVFELKEPAGSGRHVPANIIYLLPLATPWFMTATDCWEYLTAFLRGRI